MKLGEKIKYLRKSKGISQEELAIMLKINRKTIAKYWNEYQTNIEKYGSKSPCENEEIK